MQRNRFASFALLFVMALLLSACQFTPPPPPVAKAPAPATVSNAEKIASAMSAGPSVIAQKATIMDYPAGWPGNWPKEPAAPMVELRAGSNGWSCLPDDPSSPGNDPLCANETYWKVLQARYALEDSPTSGIGIGYMLLEGAPDNSPPHMMIFVPGSNDGLSQFGTDPGPLPWVMLPGTSHQHMMVTMLPQPKRVSVDEDKIANATSAGPAVIAQDAAVMDYPDGWPGKWPNEPAAPMVELRAGTNGWTCFVDNPDSPGNDPMCMNETYLESRMAQLNLVDSPSTGIGIGYMLQEGAPAGSPPHMMVFVPGSNDGLDQFGTDPGPLPWVMYPGTSHEHLMVTILRPNN